MTSDARRQLAVLVAVLVAALVPTVFLNVRADGYHCGTLVSPAHTQAEYDAMFHPPPDTIVAFSSSGLDPRVHDVSDLRALEARAVRTCERARDNRRRGFVRAGVAAVLLVGVVALGLRRRRPEVS